MNDTTDTIETELVPSYSGATPSGNIMRVSMSSKGGGITTVFPVPASANKLTAKVWVSLIAGEIVLQVGSHDRIGEGNNRDYKETEGWKQLTLTNNLLSAAGTSGQILLYSTVQTGTTFYVCAPEVIGIE